MTETHDLELMHEGLRLRRLHPLADGVLSSGQPWLSAIEPDALGGIGHVLISHSGGADYVHLNVFLGLRSHDVVGDPGFARSNDIRAYCWNARPDVTAVEILHGPAEACGEPLAADLVLETEDAKLYVAMIDASVSVRAARMLSNQGEILATMDLSQDQAHFGAMRDWHSHMLKVGLDRAGPHPLRRPHRAVT